MDRVDYKSAGVNYDSLDAFKRMCQREAASTAAELSRHGLSEVRHSRGDSAYLVEFSDFFLAHVEEGLGTKNLVADEMQRLTGKCFYHGIGIDTVAAIVNDLITSGAEPVCVAMHAAVGDSSWFADSQRAGELARGFADGCKLCGAVWGGGETPALRGLVNERSIVLAGSAVGLVNPKSRRIAGDVRDGDAIVMLASSGVHTNGLTLCRAIAGKLEQGHLTKLEDGRAYGEALLDPSVNYAPFLSRCRTSGVAIHYAVHITGHGWRKLMRLDEPFAYRITELRPAPAVFGFIEKSGRVDRREMFATFNMGAGFAVYVAPDVVQTTLDAARHVGIDAWLAGSVTQQANRKFVEIAPLEITFDAESLAVR
ncbi:MAG: AIR synthase related protein [Tepidisphaeraceae bacterium]